MKRGKIKGERREKNNNKKKEKKNLVADNNVKKHRDPARSWLCLLESRVLTA